MSDRRSAPRSSLAIRIEPQDGGDWMVAHDISLGGMMVTSRQARWPGELVRVRFNLPGAPRAIRATCRVVNLMEVPRGMGMALHFLRLHPAAQIELHRYVDRRAVEPDDSSITARVTAWVRRMIEDCSQLSAFARP